MLRLVALAALLPLALAGPLDKRQAGSGSAASGSATATAAPSASNGFKAGRSSSNVYPPPGTTPGPTSAFPDESQVGIPGPTPTGIEPREISVTVAYPYKTAAFPLIIPSPASSGQNAESSEQYQNGQFNALRYFGNLSPWYSNTDGFGLPNANPSLPDQCTISQVHLLYRHGARYPTTGAPPSAFAAKLQNATGFSASGDLAFLNTWSLGIGAELLTPFGRLQNFELGVGFRNLYGQLLNNFTAAGTLPVFSTESQDRMVRTALNFAAGFFGLSEGPEEPKQYNLLIVPEVSGYNNSNAPYEVCTNSNNARGSIGSAAAANFTAKAFQSTAARVQSLITGFNVTTTDVNGMINLCAYETVAFGWSPFCRLFTEDDFRNWEYAFDLQFYYNQGFGSPVGAAQGLANLESYIERLSGTRLTGPVNATYNSTFNNDVQMPLNQSIYADATHEVVLLDTLTALNLTAIAASGPLPLDQIPANHTFVASKIVPFATHLVVQVLECATYTPTKQIRFILNDAVVPLTYQGCPANEYNGLCAFDTVLSALQTRAGEINYAYDCLANYSVPAAGQDLNGRAPINSAGAASASPTSANAASATVPAGTASATTGAGTGPQSAVSSASAA